jgi:hypothetical protein
MSFWLVRRWGFIPILKRRAVLGCLLARPSLLLQLAATSSAIQAKMDKAERKK